MNATNAGLIEDSEFYSKELYYSPLGIETELIREAIIPTVHGEPVQFTAFPKISRLKRDMVITEKLDGTNAAIIVTDDGRVQAQSRKRLIYPGKSTDNMGFAAWVQEHSNELAAGLGAGLHFGEWWGQGIQRGYGLDEKRFSLFNTSRWAEDRPDCCGVVPILAEHTFNTEVIQLALETLQKMGSLAAPGYDNPEGIVVYHTAANQLFKLTLKDDDTPKSQLLPPVRI